MANKQGRLRTWFLGFILGFIVVLLLVSCTGVVEVPTAETQQRHLISICLAL